MFRCVCCARKTWGEGVSERVVWYVVKDCAKAAGIQKLAPHDLRRTCARLCHLAGGELEQIQFLLGHVSVQTTEIYLGCRQRLRAARLIFPCDEETNTASDIDMIDYHREAAMPNEEPAPSGGPDQNRDPGFPTRADAQQFGTKAGLVPGSRLRWRCGLT